MQKVIAFALISMLLLAHGSAGVNETVSQDASSKPLKKRAAFNSASFRHVGAASSKASLKTIVIPTKPVAAVENARLPVLSEMAVGDASKIKMRINAISTVIKAESRPEQQRAMLLNRGTSYYQLAKANRLGCSTQTAAGACKALTKQYLDAAEADLTAVGKKADSSPINSSYLCFVRALIRLDQDDYEGAKAFLRTSIAQNPKADYAIGVSLYLADDLFQANKLDEALKEYNRFLKVMSPSDALRAKYHLAWIYVKKNEARLAESYLIDVIRSVSDLKNQFRVSALHELPEIASTRHSEDELIQLAEKDLRLDTRAEVDLLSDCIMDRVAREKTIFPMTLFSRVMSLETRPTERLRWRFQRARDAHAEKLTADYEARFDELVKEFVGLAPDQRAPMQKNFGAELQSENEFYIASLSDMLLAHTGSESTAPSPADKKAIQEIGAKLRHRIAFQEKNFKATSKNRGDLYRLQLDVCSAQEDWVCVVKTVQLVDGDAGLKSIRAGSQIDRIAALEELNKKEASRWHAVLLKALAVYVTDPAQSDWVEVAKRLSVFYVSDKAFALALPLLETIDRREHSEDSYYRLQLARFDDAKFNDVTKDSRAALQTPRIVELVRESHLRLARAAIQPAGADKSRRTPASEKPEDFATYETHLKEFLKLSNDPAKRVPVIKDYLSRLELTKDTAKLLNEVMALAEAERFRPELQEFARRLINESFETGRFADVVRLIGQRSRRDKDLQVTAALADLGLGLKPDAHWLNSFDKARLNYVLGLLVLSSPADFDSIARRLPETSKPSTDLLFLSAKLKSCNPPLKLSRAQLKEFGSRVPPELRPSPLLPLEIEMAKIKFDKVKKLSPVATAKLMAKLEAVRKLRAKVGQRLPASDWPVRLRLLSSAKDLERSAADAIQAAPLPSGLTRDQATEYKAGVSQMANEFIGQSTEFTHALANLNTQVNEARAKAAVPVKKVGFEKWPWPSGEVEAKFTKQVKKRPLLPQLLILDFLKSAHQLSDESYYALRSGVLITKIPCDYMVEYVFQELGDAKQDRLIESWKAL